MSEITYSLLEPSEVSTAGKDGAIVLRNPQSHVVQVTKDGRSLAPKSFATISDTLDEQTILMLDSGQLVVVAGTRTPAPGSAPAPKSRSVTKSKTDASDSEGPAAE